MEKTNLISSRFLKEKNDVKTNHKKLSSIIFSRACCSIGIVIFHFLAHSKGNIRFLFHTANSDFGFMYVTCFFCISGVVLYYNYPKIKSIKAFYYKRWKSIFPPYYICFFYFFLRNAFNFHKLFFKGHWSKILFTLIGLDGYLFYRIETYYIVGEWFLGAIVIIYVVYPLLLFIIKGNSIIINNCIMSFLYFLMIKKKYFIISKTRNIITCIMSFYFGIESIRFKEFYLTNKKSLVFFMLIFVLLYKIKIKHNFFILFHQIQGFSLFIILFHLGKNIMKTKLNVIFIEISNLSYYIYLFHHQIIIDVLSINNPKEWHSQILLLGIVILLTIICSKILLIITNSIFTSSIFKKLDSIFI
jgi:peptidoglycan/LPS O-acetylase OafA/YrhL